MLLRCCNQYASIFGKLIGGHRTGKHQFWFQSLPSPCKKKGNAKECLNYRTCTHLTNQQGNAQHFPVEVNSTWTENFQMLKLDLERSEEPEIKLSTSTGSQRKQESSRKTSTHALLTVLKPLTMWITIICGKFLTRWEYQTTLPAPEKSVCRSRNES